MEKTTKNLKLENEFNYRSNSRFPQTTINFYSLNNEKRNFKFIPDLMAADIVNSILKNKI
jgi:hypothetical protein